MKPLDFSSHFTDDTLTEILTELAAEKNVRLMEPVLVRRVFRSDWLPNPTHTAKDLATVQRFFVERFPKYFTPGPELAQGTMEIMRHSGGLILPLQLNSLPPMVLLMDGPRDFNLTQIGEFLTGIQGDLIEPPEGIAGAFYFNHHIFFRLCCALMHLPVAVSKDKMAYHMRDQSDVHGPALRTANKYYALNNNPEALVPFDRDTRALSGLIGSDMHIALYDFARSDKIHLATNTLLDHIYGGDTKRMQAIFKNGLNAADVADVAESLVDATLRCRQLMGGNLDDKAHPFHAFYRRYVTENPSEDDRAVVSKLTERQHDYCLTLSMAIRSLQAIQNLMPSRAMALIPTRGGALLKTARSEQRAGLN